MQITDVSVTLFSWDDIPATQYGRHSGRFAGKSDLGLVTIRTDQGVEGHSFIGSSSRPASGDANLIVRIAKPMLMGEHPLDRERHFQRMWSRMRMLNQLRPLGAVDVAFGTLPARSPICPCTG
jgi:L-alanine-DL-glutamate epimerase-like enolase superfamily enzyme